MSSGNDPVVCLESAGRPSDPGRPLYLTEVPRGGLVALLGDAAGRADVSVRNAHCTRSPGAVPHIAGPSQPVLGDGGGGSARRSGAVALLGLVVTAAGRAHRDPVVATSAGLVGP